MYVSSVLVSSDKSTDRGSMTYVDGEGGEEAVMPLILCTSSCVPDDRSSLRLRAYDQLAAREPLVLLLLLLQLMSIYSW